MADNGEIVTEREAVEGGMTPVSVWLKHVERAKEDMKPWCTTAKEAISIYETEPDEGQSRIAFNILHSNIETIVPALYNSTPIPDIRRRFNDKDPVAKQGVDIIERCLSFTIDQYDLDGSIMQAVTDSELPGRGTVRVRYKPQLTQQQDPMSGESYEQLGYQEVSCEHVIWDKWGHGPGRSWAEVPFVYFEHDLTRDDLEQMGVPPERIEELSFTGTDDGRGRADRRSKDAKKGIFKTLPAYEIWDKRRKLVIFVTPQDKDKPLLVEQDPLRLRGFFPVPAPILPLRKRNSLRPITPYEVYKPLVEELETITRRITSLIKQLKVRGIYSAELGETLERLKLAEDGQYESASNDAAAFQAGAGGLENAVAHWPMEPTVLALRELYVQREQIKQTIYEVSGISDIVRGATDPNETLGAQQIKAQWGSQRIQRRQAEVARFARDLFRMKAEIICEHFTSENIQAMTQLELPPEVEQMLRSDAMRGYRIDIESDSTIRADMSRSQEQMNMFLQSTATYAQAVAGMVQALPSSLPTWIEVYTSFARKFKLGKAAEDALEQLSAQAQQIAQQAAQAQQGPSPEERKAELEAQSREQEMGMRREEHGMTMQAIEAQTQAKVIGAQASIAQAQARALPPMQNGQPQRGIN